MPLNPSRERARLALQARAAELRRDLGKTLHDEGAREDLGLPNRNAEVDDAAVAESETILDIAAVQRDARELEEVNAALARIDTADFGLCVDCGGEIAAERLAAQPQAARCIECEREAERRAPR
jgi:RNA polymerase-binding protein DksA